MTEKKHTRKSFDQELSQLKDTIIDMMVQASQQVERAMKALATGDEVLAAKTIANDAGINRLRDQVDACTLRLLALRQPVAKDLRFIMASHRMGDDLERVADYAVGISRRSLEQGGRELGDPVEILHDMGNVALDMLTKAKTAFENGDVDLALEAWNQDDQIDEKYVEAIQELQLIMSGDTDCVEPCTAMLSAAKAIERIGDHVTNVSEEIYFMVTGKKLASSLKDRY